MERELNKAMRVLQKNAPQRFTLGIVYEPDVTDTQGDFAKAEDIESAAWEFLARLQQSASLGASVLKAAAEGASCEIEITDLMKSGLDDMHLQVGDEEDLGTIVESYLAPTDLAIDGQPVKKGAWLLGVRWSPAMFAKIQAGERTGLSFYGRAEQVEA